MHYSNEGIIGFCRPGSIMSMRRKLKKGGWTMPAIFAHWLLGEKVLDKLDAEKRKVLIENRQAFNLGLQGPDFMFFKDMGADREAMDLAESLHKSPASYALTAFSKVYSNSKKPTALAYILGFIGHFALDTNCHGYVYRVVDRDRVDHNELETEFDRFLMMNQGLDPSKVKIEDLIALDRGDLKAIVPLYEVFNKVSEEKLAQSFTDFHKYKKMIRTIQTRAAFMIDPTLKLVKKDHLYGIFMKKEANRLLEPYMLPMEGYFKRALEVYPQLMEDYLKSLEGKDLAPYFSRNFVRIGEED